MEDFKDLKLFLHFENEIVGLLGLQNYLLSLSLFCSLRGKCDFNHKIWSTVLVFQQFINSIHTKFHDETITKFFHCYGR